MKANLMQKIGFTLNKIRLELIEMIYGPKIDRIFEHMDAMGEHFPFEALDEIADMNDLYNMGCMNSRDYYRRLQSILSR